MKKLLIYYYSNIFNFTFFYSCTTPDADFDTPKIPTVGLLAYYTFDGNANDESGNDNNGTVHGAILQEDRFGNSNSAYFFDGGDYIHLGNNNILPSGENPFTLSIWLYSQGIMSIGAMNNY